MGRGAYADRGGEARSSLGDCAVVRRHHANPLFKMLESAQRLEPEWREVATQEKLMTAEELLLLPDDGMRYELVRGELRRMPPPGARHEAIAAQIMLELGPFVKT